jgi:hypothetical protein
MEPADGSPSLSRTFFRFSTESPAVIIKKRVRNKRYILAVYRFFSLVGLFGGCLRPYHHVAAFKARYTVNLRPLAGERLAPSRT